MTVIDYSAWRRLEAMVEELGGVKALDEAIESGVAEVHEVGSLTLARHLTLAWQPEPKVVRLPAPKTDKLGVNLSPEQLKAAGFLTIQEMADKLNCSTRTVQFRVAKKQMERLLVRGSTGGGIRSYVRQM